MIELVVIRSMHQVDGSLLRLLEPFRLWIAF